MLSWLFGKKQKNEEMESDDEATSVHWGRLWPTLGDCRFVTLTGKSVQEPEANASLRDGAEVSRYSMFEKWPIGTNFQPEPVGDVGIRLHALPRKFDHTGKSDLTNCIGFIVLKNSKAEGYWVMLYDYEYGYGVHKGSPENLNGEPVVQRYQEKNRSFYFTKFDMLNGTLSLGNMNWKFPAIEKIGFSE